MDPFLRDLRYALRHLGRQRALTVLVVLTLGAGIACSTAMFSVVRAVLLNPLPWHEVDRLAMISKVSPQTGDAQILIDEPELLDLRRLATGLEVSGFTAGNANLVLEDRAEALWISHVAAGLFDALGTEAALGRVFAPEEYEDGHRVVLLSHEVWRDVFAGDPGAVGRRVRLDGELHEIVGVMPRDYPLPVDYRWVGQTQIWRPLPLQDENPRPQLRLFTIARLKPDVTRVEARAEIDRLSAELRRRHDATAPWELRLVPVEDEVVGRVRPALLALFGAVGFVLLIACANVANLLLARTDARRGEIALRLALGAGRRRLVAQVLIESLVLALLGAAAGIVGSHWGVRALLALRPGNLPRIGDVTIDFHVLAFTLAVSLATALLFGLAPAFHALRTDLRGALHAGTRGAFTGLRGQRGRRLLVIGEIALALVLVAGAGLMAASLGRLGELDLGFDPERLAAGDLMLPASRYGDDASVLAFYDRILEEVAAVPEVEWAGLTNVVPFWSGIRLMELSLDGRPPEETRELRVGVEAATPGLLEAMGLRLLEGRDLASSDREDALPVVLVNEMAARRFWPGESPLGRRLRLGDDRPWLTVVGVIGDAVATSLEDPRPERVLVPYRQTIASIGAAPRYMALMVRAHGDPAAAVAAARRAARAVDPEIPLGMLKSMEEHVAVSALARYRFGAFVLGLFAAVAFLLALVGVYGLLSYLVARSRQAIGVRVALGARRGDVVRHVVGQGLVLTGLGLALGIPAALASGRFIESLLFGVEPTDPMALGVAVVLVLTAAAAASYGPARRALEIDPMEALRSE